MAPIAVSAFLPRSFVDKFLLAVAFLLSGLFAVNVLSSWTAKLRYPGEIDSVEGRELAEMALLHQGVPIYAPATPREFHSANYGPLYYLLGARLMDPAAPGYRSLRLVAIVALAALAAACGVLAWWVSRSWAAAVLSPLMFLSYRLVTRYGVTARSDSLGLLCWFSGYLVAYRYRTSDKLLWSIPLLVLGAFYKQQFIVAPVAIVLFLLLEKRYRTAWQFSLLLAGAGLAMLGVFQFLVFPHQAFALHFIAYNVLPFSLSEGLLRVSALLIVLALPAVMAISTLRSYPHRLLACYFGAAMILIPIMVSKKGAAVNYALEWLVLACPLVATYVVSKLKQPETGVLALFLLGVSLWLGQSDWGRSLDPTPTDFAQERAVQAYLRGNFPPGATALGYFTGDLLRAGMATPLTDPYQYSWLVRNGALSDEGLIEEIQQHQFAVILLTQNMRNEASAHDPQRLYVSERLHQAILHNYRLARRFDFHLYEAEQYYAWVPQ